MTMETFKSATERLTKRMDVKSSNGIMIMCMICTRKNGGSKRRKDREHSSGN